MLFGALILLWAIISQLHGYNLTVEQKEILVKIKSSIENPTVNSWTYRENYTNLDSMMLTEDIMNNAIMNDGFRSRLAIERMLLKAVEGEDVTLYIFGESVSVGADLGKDNIENIFHYAFAKWWNETIGLASRSHMIRKNLAIGGVMTKYFSKCWREYVKKHEKIDMAIWEFNINDVKDDQLETSVEWFTRSIFDRYKQLNLMFTIFYSRSIFDNDRYLNDKKEEKIKTKRHDSITDKRKNYMSAKKRNINRYKNNEIFLDNKRIYQNNKKRNFMNDPLNDKRHDISEDIVKSNAKYYDLTCFNIETFVNDSQYKIQKVDMFTKMHPSVLAHAQMAISLIRYYTKVITDIIKEWVTEGVPMNLDKARVLPKPKYVPKLATFDTVCWTAALTNINDYYKLPHPLFGLKAISSRKVVPQLSSQDVEEERFDALGGYFIKTNGEIYISFQVPSNHTQCEIALANMQGDQTYETRVHIYRNLKIYAEALIIGAGRVKAQYVDTIASVASGEWTLHIQPYKGTFLLNAIIIC